MTLKPYMTATEAGREKIWIEMKWKWLMKEGPHLREGNITDQTPTPPRGEFYPGPQGHIKRCSPMLFTCQNAADDSPSWISPLTTSDFPQQPKGCHDHPLPMCGECRSCCFQHYLDHDGVMTWLLMKAPSLWSAEPTIQLHVPLWLHVVPPIWQHVPYRAVSQNLQGNQTQGSLEGLLEKCWPREHRDGTQENSDTDVLSASGTPSWGLCLGPRTASH